MIRTVADLLGKFIEKEPQAFQTFINENGVTHPTTTGTMFESLSKKSLGFALLSSDLVVSYGFVRERETGKLSNQIDCLLADKKG